MDEIINMVQNLIDKGYAYVIDHNVYYSVEKFADYGELSGRSLDDMMAGARIEVDDRKHNPMDFALWKGAKPGEPSWDSPWGKGRPGWHIECSAMSNKYLGDTFDFHGGGSDPSAFRTMKTKSPSPKPLRARSHVKILAPRHCHHQLGKDEQVPE